MSRVDSVIRLKPYEYIHILDNNTNVSRVHLGPDSYLKKDHETVTLQPQKMVVIPPRHYCVINNPVVKADDGVIRKDKHGQVIVQHGEQEVRFEQEPFPLHPGEAIASPVRPLQLIEVDQALRLVALRDFNDGDFKRLAGDEWLFKGPGTYIPRIEVKIAELLKAIIIPPNSALRLRARRQMTDAWGVERKTGEEWIAKVVGSYLPSVDEAVVNIVNPYILTDELSLHLSALHTFEDIYGKKRLAGEEWLVRRVDTDLHIPDVYEEVVGLVKIHVLQKHQYAVVCDPIGENGKPRLGARVLRRGPCTFFLRPGESLEKGVQNSWILEEDEAVLLICTEAFTDVVDGKEKKRTPGDRWMIHGPLEFVPQVTVDVAEKRKRIPMDESEGIYVRDIRSGRVRVVKGESYMLKDNEELWRKDLPNAVLDILRRESQEDIDLTHLVTLRARHNTAVQVYNYASKTARVVFGPDLVQLDPEEQFTILSLSGSKPKKPHQIKSIGLFLGPDFMTDIIQVETSDHARLRLQLSYNWTFDVDGEDPTKLFQVPDFVGDACKAIASRVRGAVAGVNFDLFHKTSARIIRAAVFGLNENGKVNDFFKFKNNGLVITNIDIQSVEPIDQRTRDALQKSVQMAIEITVAAQEAFAKHTAEINEQEAKAVLMTQTIGDQALAEEEKKVLLEYQSMTAAIETQGAAKALAKARSEADKVDAESSVKLSEAKIKADTISSVTELGQLKKKQMLDVEYQTQIYEIELDKEQRVADIESMKFKSMVEAIGADTIANIARAGPEMQSKLLKGLGLHSMLLTDGSTPINLFDTANSLVESAAVATAKIEEQE